MIRSKIDESRNKVPQSTSPIKIPKDMKAPLTKNKAKQIVTMRTLRLCDFLKDREEIMVIVKAKIVTRAITIS